MDNKIELEFTTHAIERSLERTGMTGVQLNNFLKSRLRPFQLKYKEPKNIYIGHLRISIKENLIITVVNTRLKGKIDLTKFK